MFCPAVPECARTFPCPLCAARLDLRQSRAHKPYCVCNACGLQLFFRGKAGIARLDEVLNREQPSGGSAVSAVEVFHRLEHVRAQKNALEHKQGLIFVDTDLAHAIRAVDHEIARLQRVLDELADSPRTTT